MHRNAKSNHNQSTNSRLVLVNVDNSKTVKSIIEKMVRYNKQIISNLQFLFELRMIEKIARPIPIQNKQKLVDQYKEVLDSVHEKMAAIENDKDLNTLVNEKQSQNLEKIKKKLQTLMHVKLSLFGIRKKYTEVLIQSSLVYYQKIASIYSIKLQLKTIDVDKWLTNCVQKMQKNSNANKQSCC